MLLLLLCLLRLFFLYFGGCIPYFLHPQSIVDLAGIQADDVSLMDDFVHSQDNVLKVIEDDFACVGSFGDEEEHLSQGIDNFFHQNEILALLHNQVDLEFIDDFEEDGEGTIGEDFSCKLWIGLLCSGRSVAKMFMRLTFCSRLCSNCLMVDGSLISSSLVLCCW